MFRNQKKQQIFSCLGPSQEMVHVSHLLNARIRVELSVETVQLGNNHRSIYVFQFYLTLFLKFTIEKNSNIIMLSKIDLEFVAYSLLVLQVLKSITTALISKIQIIPMPMVLKQLYLSKLANALQVSRNSNLYCR